MVFSFAERHLILLLDLALLTGNILCQSHGCAEVEDMFFSFRLK